MGHVRQVVSDLLFGEKRIDVRALRRNHGAEPQAQGHAENCARKYWFEKIGFSHASSNDL